MFLKLRNTIWAPPPRCMFSMRTSEGTCTRSEYPAHSREATEEGLGKCMCVMWRKFTFFTVRTGREEGRLD